MLWYVWGAEDTTVCTAFSSPTMLHPGIELRTSDLAASTPTLPCEPPHQPLTLFSSAYI